MATYQGREFQSGTVGFSDTLNRYEALHRCETVACLDSIMDAASQSYSHVYLELSGDNRDLQESLAASSRFELVYDVPGVRIFRNLSESADVEPGQ
jgi:hypothetical protein